MEKHKSGRKNKRKNPEENLPTSLTGPMQSVEQLASALGGE
jgi:hypothetical protein